MVFGTHRGASHSRPTAQARAWGRAVERRQIHGQATRPAEPGMAHLSAQSCPQYCCDGLAHRSDHQLRRPARFLHCG